MANGSNSDGVDPRHFKGTSPGVLHPKPTGVQSGQTSQSRSYNFLTAIVKEVISNPEELFLDRIAHASSGDPVENPAGDISVKQQLRGASGDLISIANKEWAPYVPINSIIAHIIDDQAAPGAAKDVICFPFFPPHLSLPVKPGEYVWLIQEDNKGSDVYYWMCRKVGIRQVDDINLTHLERQNDVIDAYRAWEKGTPLSDDKVGTVSAFEKATDGTGLESGTSFTEIHRTSIAFKEEFTGEPVPRHAKDCADLLLQGSNNAHIMLGTEKFTIPEENEKDDRELAPFEPTRMTGEAKVGALTKRKPLSPEIDLCVGRKIGDLLDFAAKTKDDMPALGLSESMAVMIGARPTSEIDLHHMEVDKTQEVQDKFVKDKTVKEFIDFNALNCLGRIYMTNSIDIDRTFGFVMNENIVARPDTSGGAEGFIGLDPNERDDENSADLDVTGDQGYPSELVESMNYGAIAIYSTNLRLRSDATTKIYNSLGKSMITMTPQGDIFLQANTDGGAKIILEADGNIRIVPGENGLVKIGEDLKTEDEENAGMRPVCGAITATSYDPAPGRNGPSLMAPGLVTGAAGGVEQGAGGTGVLASNVILK